MALSSADASARRPRRPGWGQAVPFLLPNLVGFLVFTFLPVLACFALSFTDYRLAPITSLRELGHQIRFVGLRNFATLVGDETRPVRIARSKRCPE